MSPVGPVPGPRVVSLVPSLTESLAAWGVVPLACTRFCERPDLPQVGGTKDPDVDAIVALRPDLVVVCDEENRREDFDALVAAGIAVHSCSPRSVADVGPALEELAVRLDLDVARHQGPIDHPPLDLRAFVPVWRRPWMTMNRATYGSDLLARLGVVNVYDSDPERYPTTDLATVRSRSPDVVLAPSEPYPFRTRHLEELNTVAPTILLDGQDLFWWGVRTPDAMVRLRRAIAGGEVHAENGA